MKPRLFIATATLFVCLVSTKSDGVAQVKPVIDIKINGHSLSVDPEDVQKVKQLIKSSAPVKREPSTDKRSGEETSSRLIASLVQQFKLDKPIAPNDKLAFGEEEIKEWASKQLDESVIKREFAARRIVLEAAGKQNVVINNQEQLSQAARNIMGILSDEVIKSFCDAKNSATAIQQAWTYYESKNFDKVLACTQFVIDGWSERADEQQTKRTQNRQCDLTPSPSDKDTYFGSYWALSDVAAAWFIRGKVFKDQQKWGEAREAFRAVTDRFNCACIWDPDGPWFWKVVDEATFELRRLSTR
jgi:hypothetical protein